MSATIAAMSADQKRKLLEQLLAGERLRPLSFAQERLFFIEMLAPGTALYNIPSSMQVAVPIDARVLDRALQEIARRHEILRTRFVMVGGRPLQQVVADAEIVLDVDDLRGLPAAAQQEELTRLAKANAELAFDLSQAPLLRCRLVRCDNASSHLFWCVHHICSDAWSAGVFMSELAQLYDAFSQGAPSPLPKLPLQYADYAEWQRGQLSGPNLERLLAYWRASLAGAPASISPPADYPRPKTPTYAGGVITAALDKPTTAALSRLARDEQATPFMVLLAALAIFMQRLTGQDDIVIGSPAVNRDQAEFEHLIGFFVNTLVLRTDLSGAPSFRELLRRVRATTLAAYEHQELPFEKLVQELRPQRTLSHHPLFQVMLVLQDVPNPKDRPTASVETQGPRVAPNGNGMSKFDLTLFAGFAENKLEFGWEFSRDLFRPSTVEDFAAMFCRLLERIAAAPDQNISRFGSMESHERESWNELTRGARTRIPDRTVDQLFRTQAAAIANRDAVVAPEKTLTYRELDDMSDRLAAAIQAAQLRGGPVGILLPRGWRPPVAILGVLKSRCPYVPLDLSYPQERLDYMIAQSGLKVLICTDPTQRSDVQIIDFDAAVAAPSAGPHAAAEPSPLAYIMYTSGSTGRPKGVMMPHLAASNLIHWQIGSEDGKGRKTLQFAPLSFDVSFQEIFSTWLAGGTLFTIDDSMRVDFPTLWNYIAEQGIQRLFLPYVALHALAEATMAQDRKSSLELVITAGEQLHIAPTIRAFFQRQGAELRNQYGPTETHVVAEHVLRGDPRAWPERPPIGKPVPNCTVLILDRYGNPSPAGSAGEIFVAGAQLAAGYWNDPELTANRFRKDPSFPDEAMLYRTGDVGRFLADASIEFLGRVDDQVKIRGYRVETAEVASALLRHSAVAEAVVIAEPMQDGSQRLAAYVTLCARAALDAQALRQWCARQLPDYMIPSRFTILDAFPLTPSGKIAARDLPTLSNGNAKTEPRSADLTPTESEILSLVEELLELRGASISDDFFSLGGHSLLAMRLVTQIRDRFGVEMPIKVLFESPGLRALATYITEQLANDESNAALALASIESMSDQEASAELGERA